MHINILSVIQLMNISGVQLLRRAVRKLIYLCCHLLMIVEGYKDSEYLFFSIVKRFISVT